MPRGKKTPPEVVYQIMTSWAVTDNYSETGRELGIAESTVEKIVKQNKSEPEFVKLCDEKRKDFTIKASKIINKALNKLEKTIDEHDDIPVNHLTTVIGTLYDKRALAKGESTQNMVIDVKLPPEVNEYAE